VKALGGDKCLRRLLDLNELDHIDLSFNDMHRIQSLRDKAKKGYTQSVRICLHAKEMLAIGLSNMVRAMLEEPHYQIAVHRDINDAMKWLGLPKEAREYIEPKLCTTPSRQARSENLKR
jgi:hypothetical protein